nr:H-NS histone family protein [Paraburkholderia franconis]
MATLENLQAKIAKLQAQAEAIAKKESSTVIAKICDIMQKHGLTVADIEAQIGGGKKRGRKPAVQIANTAVSAVKTKSSAGTTGKLPPKYRDPKTGATWSGHARPPQWIAGAKDRSKFLIDSSSAASAPAARRLPKLAPTSADLSRRNILTPRPAQPGAAAAPRRHGWLVPRTVRHS